MQADIDISDSDIYVKECVVDGSHFNFVIITKDSIIRLLMTADVLNQSINLMKLTLPEAYQSVENKENKDNSRRKFDMTLRAVDVRVGGPSQFRGPSVPELRLYTGKKRKHSVQVRLSWGQMALLQNVMESIQEVAAVA